MAREITVRLTANINRPIAYLGVAMKMAGEWLIRKSIKVRAHGA